MPHLRTQIRESVATLVTGLTTTASRVYQSRMRPVKADQMPCLLVTTNDESIEATTLHAGPQDRTLDLVIRGFAMGGDLDNTLDQIALEVETALGSTAHTLKRIEIDFDDELEKPVGSISLTYEVLYFTQAGNPGVSA